MVLKNNKIGLFFGSFNPIHVGHLIIANFVIEYTDINNVWFVVSPHNPLKEKKTLLAFNQRLAMVRIAIEDDNRFRASDIENNLTLPSYTINTLLHLNEKYPDKRFSLIMGADNLATIKNWKSFEVILSNYDICVYNRHDIDISKISERINIVDAPRIEISSSYIRNAIKEKKCVKYMLTPKVYDYIKEMHFYEK